MTHGRRGNRVMSRSGMPVATQNNWKRVGALLYTFLVDSLGRSYVMHTPAMYFGCRRLSTGSSIVQAVILGGLGIFQNGNVYIRKRGTRFQRIYNYFGS